MGSIPKLRKKNIPKSINDMSKEMLQETLKKKKECNSKALLTVEKLCEPNVDEEWFLGNLQFINQCHFDDAIAERAITKICGYPLCDQKLDKVPTQQYHISTRYNKVFDITERKNFCCSTCFKSATYVKNQLFTSPLWFRDQEVIPKYKVLRVKKSSEDEKISFFLDKVKLRPNHMDETNALNRTIDVNKTVNEIKEKCECLKFDDGEKFITDKSKTTAVETPNFNDNKPTKKNLNNEIYHVLKDKNVQDYVSNSKNTDNKTFQSLKICKPQKSAKTTTRESVQDELTDTITKIEKNIIEWISIDTLFFLLGEKKLKEKFQNTAHKVKEILNSKVSVGSKVQFSDYNEKIDKIIKLYGLLDSDFLSRNEIKTNLKPLPDYSALKEEGKTLEIKVRAFYQGQLEVKSAVKEEKEKEKEEQECQPDLNPIYLPLVDAHAQVALRRKIIMDKLNRVLPELIRVFSSDYILEVNDVRHLVSTFILTAHNIIFKPREWHLVGLIIIKLLCLKEKQLELIMNSQWAKSQILLILAGYQLKKDYLNDLLEKLTDGTSLIKKLETN